jgi:hypothetical protein
MVQEASLCSRNKRNLLLDHIVVNPLFAILIYLFSSIACFRPIDRQVESEPLENFQDINFKDLKQ